MLVFLPIAVSGSTALLHVELQQTLWYKHCVVINKLMLFKGTIYSQRKAKVGQMKSGMFNNLPLHLACVQHFMAASMSEL